MAITALPVAAAHTDLTATRQSGAARSMCRKRFGHPFLEGAAMFPALSTIHTAAIGLPRQPFVRPSAVLLW